MAKAKTEYDHVVKIVLIGDTNTGKSSFLGWFVNNKIPDDLKSTIGVEFGTKTDKDARIKMQVWDTAGQERFRTITQSYYREVQVFVVFCDLNNRETYDNLPNFIQNAKKQGKENASVIIVGSKKTKTNESSDTEVNQAELEDLAREHGAQAKIIDVHPLNTANGMEELKKEVVKQARKQCEVDDVADDLPQKTGYADVMSVVKRLRDTNHFWTIGHERKARELEAAARNAVLDDDIIDVKNDVRVKEKLDEHRNPLSKFLCYSGFFSFHTEAYKAIYGDDDGPNFNYRQTTSEC